MTAAERQYRIELSVQTEGSDRPDRDLRDVAESREASLAITLHVPARSSARAQQLTARVASQVMFERPGNYADRYPVALRLRVVESPPVGVMVDCLDVADIDRLLLSIPATSGLDACDYVAATVRRLLLRPPDEPYGIRVTQVHWASVASGSHVVGTKEELSELAAWWRDHWEREHAVDDVVLYEVVPYVGSDPAERPAIDALLAREKGATAGADARYRLLPSEERTFRLPEERIRALFLEYLERTEHIDMSTVGHVHLDVTIGDGQKVAPIVAMTLTGKAK